MVSRNSTASLPLADSTANADEGFSGFVARQREVALERLAGRIEKHASKAVGQLIVVGVLLRRGWRLFATRGRGSQFGAWLDRDLGMARSTAYELMQMADHFDGCPVAERIGVTSLKLLSGPGVSQSARDTVIERAEADVRLSVEEVKRIIAGEKGEAAARAVRPKPLSVAVEGMTLVLHSKADVDRERATRLLQQLAAALQASEDAGA